MKELSGYEFNARVLELIAEIDSAEAQDSAELVAELEATLTELYPAIDAKRESYVHVVRSAEAQASALREESRRLAQRAHKMQTLAKRLKQVVHDDLGANGEVSAHAGIFRLRIAQSPPRVKLQVPPERLPRQFQKVSVSANTNAIRQALQDGQSVEGAELEKGTHLRIQGGDYE